MDPLSLAASIAGLIALTQAATRLVSSYATGVKTAGASVSKLAAELGAAESSLLRLQQFLDRRPSGFEQTSSIWSCASSFRIVLEGLCAELGKLDKDKINRWTWPLKKEEHDKTVREIRAFLAYIHLALTIDGSELLAKSLDDVVAMLKGVEDLTLLNDLAASNTRIEECLNSQSDAMQADVDEKQRGMILSWVSNVSQDHRHHTTAAARAEGTGSWMIGSDEFADWKQGGKQPNILWCHGIQGSGKSVLMSLAIDHLTEQASGEEGVAVAYWYFDYRESMQQTASTAIASLLRQVLSQLWYLPESIREAFRHHGKYAKQLSLQSLQTLFLDAVEAASTTYVVVDALDECADIRQRKDILAFLQAIAEVSNVRVLLSSRKHQSDVNDALKGAQQIAITARDSDLEQYMHQEIQRSGACDIVDDNLAAEIVSRIINKADGMFLLTILHLRAVLNEPTAGEMEDALESLGNTLSDAFEETIDRIRRLPESRCRLGLAALAWVCQKHVMTVDELADILSVRKGQTDANPRYRPTLQVILDSCQGLVVAEAEAAAGSGSSRLQKRLAGGRIIRPAHLSIKEFLYGHMDSLLPYPEAELAETCLTYLLFTVFEQEPCMWAEKIDRKMQEYPFLAFASQHWGTFVEPVQRNPAVRALLDRLLKSGAHLASMRQIWSYSQGFVDWYWNQRECRSANALHTVCRTSASLDHIAEELLQTTTAEGEKLYPVNAQTQMGSTAIILAAAGGHATLVQLLLNHGADPNLRNWYGSALHCAAEAGQADIIRLLVETCGMDPEESFDSKNFKWEFRRPLISTLDQDQGEAFETLVDLGASPSRPLWGSERSPILQILVRRCDAVLDVVLRRGWLDPKMPLTEGEPLGEMDQMQNLKANRRKRQTKRGARNAQVLALEERLPSRMDWQVLECRGLLPLQYAAAVNNVSACKRLLEAGADADGVARDIGCQAPHDESDLSPISDAASAPDSASLRKFEALEIDDASTTTEMHSENGEPDVEASSTGNSVEDRRKRHDLDFRHCPWWDGDVEVFASVSPLEIAILTGNVQTVALLLDHGSGARLGGQTGRMVDIRRGRRTSDKALILGLAEDVARTAERRHRKAGRAIG